MKPAKLLDRNLFIGLGLELGAILLYTPITNYFYSGGSWPVGPFLLASLYAAGIYFIFKSGITYGLKLLLSYWWVGVVAYLGAESIIVYIIESREYKYEAYLVPPGFHGKLTITFHQPLGEDPILEGDQVVFILHADGTLKSKFQRKKYRHFEDQYPRFYYVDEEGTRKPIKQVGDPTIGENEVFIQFLVNRLTERQFLVCTQKEHEAYFN